MVGYHLPNLRNERPEARVRQFAHQNQNGGIQSRIDSFEPR